MTAENLDGNSSANTTATTQSNKPVTQPTLPSATEKRVNDRGIVAVTADCEDDFLRGFNLDDKEAQMRFQTHPYTPPQTTSQVANPSAEYKTLKPLNSRGITPVIATFGYEPKAGVAQPSNTAEKSRGAGGGRRGDSFGSGISGEGSFGGGRRGDSFGSRISGEGSFGGNRGIFGDGTRSGGVFGERGRGGGFGSAAMVLGLTGISGTVHNAVEQTKEQLAEEGAKLLLSGEMPNDAQLEALELDEPHARGMMVVFQMANLKDTFGSDVTELPIRQMFDFNAQENTLTNAQRSRLNTLTNTINDHLKESDFSGTLRDLQGDPVPNGKGGFYNHLSEMKDSYRSLQKIRQALEGSLKNPTLSLIDRTLLQDGLNNTIFYINRIEELFDPYGGIS